MTRYEASSLPSLNMYVAGALAVSVRKPVQQR